MATCVPLSRLPLLLVVTLLAGCGNDPSEIVDKSDRAVRSWESTVRTTAEQREAHRVPNVYVAQVLKAAGEALQEQVSSLTKVPPTDPRRQDLERRIGNLRRRMEQMSASLARSDLDIAHSVTAAPHSPNSRDYGGGGV